jgi:hypothetical protein
VQIALEVNQSAAPESQDESDQEVIVIGRRLKPEAPSNGSGGSGALLSIIAHRGGTNDPDNGLSEFLRDLFNVQTDYDIDTRFTVKQQEIIYKALQGLADHPVYGAAMFALSQKNVDINIVPDFNQSHTGRHHGITVGRNEDHTVDDGESITIYINMNYGSAPTTDISFAITMVHELMHTFGDPALDAVLDFEGSKFDIEIYNDVFTGYNFGAPPSPISLNNGITDVADTGGALTGSASYEIFSGSNAADVITPNAGGSLIYSGGGDDRFIFAIDSDIDEIIDGGGLDTLELPAGTPLSAVSIKWSSDERNLAVSVNGHVEAIMVEAASNGMIEQISIGGAVHTITSFVSTINTAPSSQSVNTAVYGSFFGGWVANAMGSDADGDTLEYRIGSISGAYADQVWTVDKNTGEIFTSVTRYAQPGSDYTFLSIVSSDGIAASTSDIMIRWGNRNEPETPIEYSVVGQANESVRFDSVEAFSDLSHLDAGVFNV